MNKNLLEFTAMWLLYKLCIIRFRRLSAAEAQIGKLAAGLNTVESRVAQLQEELAERSRGAAALQLRAETTEARLATARALLQKLDTEHRDWQAQLEELTGRKEKLDVEAANVASLLVYEVSAMICLATLQKNCGT